MAIDMKKRKVFDPVYVYLRIDRFKCHPDEISKILGVKASKVFVKGELDRFDNPIKFNSWRLESNLQSIELEKHIQSLLKKTTKFKNVVKIVPRFTCLLQVVVNARDGEDTPIMTISSRTMKMLSERNIDLDIDMYFWESKSK